MKNLLIMRHAKSNWDDPGLTDHERPLNERGEHDAPWMGEWFVRNNIPIDLILSSSALRAEKTAEAIASIYNLPVTLIPELYQANPARWQSVLSAHTEYENILGIGHNPGIVDIVHQVSGKYERIPTAAAAAFSVQDSEDVFSFDQLVLRVIWRPKELRSDSP